MALMDTMFFFEVMLEELKTFVNCSKFCIKGEFGDVFSVYLKDPNILERFSSKYTRPVKKKRKAKSSKSVEKVSTAPTVQTGQTVLFAINVDTLISNMKQHPLELSLWSKDVPDYKIGSTQIPWSAPYFEYLNMLFTEQGQESICIRGDYAIFEEASTKRMAIIKLTVQLRHFKDKITTQYRSPSQVIQRTEMKIPLNSQPGSVLSTKVKDRPINFTEETGIIKNIYGDDKRRPVRTKKKSHKEKESKSIDRVGSEKRVPQVETVQLDRTVNRRLNSELIHVVRSERNLDKNPTLTVIKCKSCSSIVQKRNLYILNDYIFGAGVGPFGNQVYCVSYFTVENDMADPRNPKTSSGKSETSRNTSEEFEKEKDRHTFRICKSECLKFAPHSSTQSACSLDITKKAAPKITVTKCSDVKCTFEKMRELPTPPDDRILIDLSSRRPDCCEHTKEMVAGMKANMTFGSHSRYCECECKFGKETTFCNICGGYEKFGGDFGTVPGYELPFPCPIFHKIKVSSSKEASDTRKKTTASEKIELKAKQSASEDGESSSKNGKKKKTDDRFKFYSYKAPHIGHCRCALSCVGALGVVPKSMGWLWNCENVPGLKVSKGWKPGAISNRLLKQLNKAKRQTRPEQEVQTKKKTKKKRIEDKPTLIICKRNGEYRVEMQVSPEDSDVNIDQCDPLVYRISREDNEERIQKRLRKHHRLVKEAVDKLWVDPYHPEICEKTCLRDYKEAVGLADSNKPECTCTVEEEDTVCSCCNGAEEDYDSSECSSMDLEWEIHFSPPIASQAC